MEDNKFRKVTTLTYLGVIVGMLAVDVYDKYKRRKDLNKHLDKQTRALVETCEEWNELIEQSKDKLEDGENKLKA